MPWHAFEVGFIVELGLAEDSVLHIKKGRQQAV